MTRLFLLGAAAAIAAGVLVGTAALAAGPSKPDPCKAIKNCITVNGPWVAVPAKGEGNFLLECPKRNGYVGGVDVLASSTDVRVTWDAGVPSTPIKSGVPLTGPWMFFRSESAGGKAGLYQPWIGCVPIPPTNPRVTVSARANPYIRPGKTLDRWQTTVRLHAGHESGTRACGKGERLLGDWSAVMFKTDAQPSIAFASKVRVDVALGDGRVAGSVDTGSIPISAFPEAQIGAVCAK